MSKKEKKIIIICIIIIIGVALTFAYIGCTKYLKEGNNKSNNIVSGMNENNNIIIEDNNIVENNIIENNIINNIENNTIEAENQNIVPEEKNELEKPNVTPNNDSELESNNDEEKVIEIVKKDWGSSDGVYFKIQAIDSNGNYVVSVNNSETTASLAWYTVNPKTGEFTN
ncbi:MAG: hypothetical protein J6K42_02620 [Clostridia bacterium]|nr:hypothetical protein [Clostridia bacterium]